VGGNWPSERRAPTIEPRRLRVLYLASSLHYGGAERQIVELVRRLDRSRFEPVLCCLDGVDTLARDLNPAAPVLPLKKRHRLDITVVPRLMRLILRQRIDVVHSFLFDAEIAGRLAGRLCGVSAVIASERNSAYPPMPVHEALLKLTRPLFDLQIANSHAGRAYSLRRLHTPPAAVRVVPNGVDVSRFRPHDASELRARLNIPAKSRVVGMFASFKPQKNHHMYVRVIQRISKILPETRFLFVGHTPSGDPVAMAHRQEILKRLEEEGLADRCLHLLERSDMEDLYCLCDVTVLTSIREGTPNVVLESMASGVPVVATDVADNARIIADAGAVVPLDDDAAMSAWVVRLLENEAVRRQMGTAARQRAVNEYSLDRLARSTEQVYLEAVHRRNGRPCHNGQ
jgi:glycosyltransferase involved in cell wall biosynthesis